MANLNKVFLIGRLTQDPELRYTPGGSAVCDFTLAVNERFKGQDGQLKENTHFVDITVWQKQAENCAEYLKKGREAFVEGKLVLDRWESKDGKKQSKLRVTAMRVQFLGSRPGGGTDATSTEEAPSTTPEEPPPAEGKEDVPF